MKNNTKKHTQLFLFLIVIVIPVLLVNFACKKEKMYVIGIINPHAESKVSGEGFIDKMGELGYVEGKNVSYIKHESKEKTDEALKEMVDKNVDLIFTYTTPAAKKAQNATANTDIPVIFILFDSVAAGLLEDRIHPSGNLTGIHLRGSVAKSLEWLLSVSPDVKKVFVPVVYDTKAANMTIEDLVKDAEKLGLELMISESTTEEELLGSLASIPQDIDAIFVPHSVIIEANLNPIFETAIKRKLPVVSSGHEHHKIGALICYGPAATATGWQVARFADKLLKGTPVSLVPVESSEFILGINLKTAVEIGVEVPEPVLKQADLIVR